MRIKQIEWESSGAVLVGKMILGASARVYPVYTDTDFMWSISDGSGRVVEQARKFVSLKQAIEECNEAWEKMVMGAFEGPAIKPLSWVDKDGNTVAYGANNMGFIIERGSDGYIVLTAPEQQYTKSHFGFETVEAAKAWCERYNNDLVEEAMEWVK